MLIPAYICLIMDYIMLVAACQAAKCQAKKKCPIFV